MRNLIALCLLVSTAAGCTPVTLGAHSIHPALNADPKETWIYLNSADNGLSGIYRCYDAQQNPLCIKAKLQSK
mgnify:FL=1